MECRLVQRSNIAWRCQVYLRIETDENARVVRNIKEKPFGGIIHSTKELETMLRRAQLAILNPSVYSSRFVTLDLSTLVDGQPPLGSEEQLAFSANVVCVTVWGPEVPDLSFIDLPGQLDFIQISKVPKLIEPRNTGIIQNEVEPGSMDAVRKMVMKHIKGNCLILLAIVSVHLAREISIVPVLTASSVLRPCEVCLLAK